MNPSSLLFVFGGMLVACLLIAALLVILSEMDTRNNRLALERMSAARRRLVEEMSRMAGKP